MAPNVLALGQGVPLDNDVSVQETADEATLNRATFYLHYPDKNALLQAMTEVRFRDLIERRGITFTDCNGALRAIALGVCDYLAENTSCPTQLARITVDGGKRSLMIAALRYYDTFVKVNGAWLFAERLLYVDWIEERDLS